MGGVSGRIALANLLLVALSPAVATAQEAIGKATGEQLLVLCEPALHMIEAGSRRLLSDVQYAQAQTCIGFVDGFIWGHGWAAWRENRDMYYCPPEQFSVRQAVPALVEYLHAHRDRLEAPAHVLLFAALSATYPCVTDPQAPAGVTPK